MRWPVWTYGIVGAGAACSFGLSAVFAAGSLLQSKAQSNSARQSEPGLLDLLSESLPGEGNTGQQRQISGSGGETERANSRPKQLSASSQQDAAGERKVAGVTHQVKEKEDTQDGWSTGQLLLGSFLLCTGLFLSNFRAFTMWQRRRKRGDFDSEAFQKAFDKFMEGRGYQEWEGKTYSRSEARAKYKQEFDDFWADYDRRFDEREKYFREENQRFQEWKRTHKRRTEYYNDGGSEHFGDRSSAGSFARASWESAEVKDALQALGLNSIQVNPRELKAVYLKRAKETHPDSWPEAEKEAAEARFKRVGAAYEVLKPLVGSR